MVKFELLILKQQIIFLPIEDNDCQVLTNRNDTMR
ncbi:hypothetical protein BC792_11580 [Sphingobacterium allocomposti]|uniref:Uncharacterized protein n=1 Tax=Sphingobacterium allocomposti TaxID=415956 RepID=A0A5S5DC90_9SPHI|nr:hypothetical protein BC792_11580 [Sphingobacterium composti Yoo et al. 2007 non Ten et al. 2007]